MGFDTIAQARVTPQTNAAIPVQRSSLHDHTLAGERERRAVARQLRAYFGRLTADAREKGVDAPTQAFELAIEQIEQIEQSSRPVPASLKGAFATIAQGVRPRVEMYDRWLKQAIEARDLAAIKADRRS